jgi:hypothetical protein
MNYGEVTNYMHFGGANFSNYVQQFSHRETDNETAIGDSEILSITHHCPCCLSHS